MDIEYTWIHQQEKSHQFRLLTWTLFIGQFVRPVEGDGVKWVDGGYSSKL